MHNRIRKYLPAIPYLVGVGLQVSGLVHLGFAVAAFELAAIIAAFVTWSYWAQWHQAAANTIYREGRIQTLLGWPGLKIPRFGTVSSQLIAAILVLVICNGVIAVFLELGEHQQLEARQESANSAQLGAFYGELGTFFNTKLPKDMTDEEYDKWRASLDAETDKILKWVRANMAHGAEYRFADVSKIRVVKWADSISERHNQDKNLIFNLQTNLLAMMATTAWDKPKQ